MTSNTPNRRIISFPATEILTPDSSFSDSPSDYGSQNSKKQNGGRRRIHCDFEEVFGDISVPEYEHYNGKFIPEDNNSPDSRRGNKNASVSSPEYADIVNGLSDDSKKYFGSGSDRSNSSYCSLESRNLTKDFDGLVYHNNNNGDSGPGDKRFLDVPCFPNDLTSENRNGQGDEGLLTKTQDQIPYHRKLLFRENSNNASNNGRCVIS